MLPPRWPSLAHDQSRRIDAVQRQAEAAVLNAWSEGPGDHAIYDLVSAVIDQVAERIENPSQTPELPTGARPFSVTIPMVTLPPRARGPLDVKFTPDLSAPRESLANA